MHAKLLLSLLVTTSTVGFTQKAHTAPANESRSPSALRSPNSIGEDLTIPLCPAHFHDSMKGNGIAAVSESGTSSPKIKSTVPALITQEAIDAAGKSHIGNYAVLVNALVDTKGNPQDLCLQKSSGYGLDASAAAAVRQYQFDAATMNGKPVRMRLPIAVRFVKPGAVNLNETPHSQTGK